MKTIKSIGNLPSPSNISLWWNFGSLLGMTLMIQITSGLLMSMFYCPNINSAFESTMMMCLNTNNGWMIRSTHANGSSLMFIFLYLHIMRGMYYKSFKMSKTWMSGMLMLLLSMLTAFLGYVLPWGQMSFWGATVITNLVSSIPYIGNELLSWIWGGVNINNMTLNRFFSTHFITPFVILSTMMVHLMFIHEKGSSNPLGTNSNMDKISFHPLFSIKDMMSMTLVMMMFTITILISPYYLSDSENFYPANPMKTPPHIKPEWYFLFTYSILRSVPNKLGGVIAMMLSILMLLILPMMGKKNTNSSFCPMTKMTMWSWLLIIMMLTWLSTKPIKEPFIMINKWTTTLYFLMIPILTLSSTINKKLIN